MVLADGDADVAVSAVQAAVYLPFGPCGAGRHTGLAVGLIRLGRTPRELCFAWAAVASPQSCVACPVPAEDGPRARFRGPRVILLHRSEHGALWHRCG